MEEPPLPWGGGEDHLSFQYTRLCHSDRKNRTHKLRGGGRFLKGIPINADMDVEFFFAYGSLTED